MAETNRTPSNAPSDTFNIALGGKGIDTTKGDIGVRTFPIYGLSYVHADEEVPG